MWRLIVAIILFLLSLLVIFKAPTNFFWKVAVAVTEFPHITTLVTLIFIAACLYCAPYRAPATVLSFAALVLFLLPVWQAYRRGANLMEELNQTFPVFSKNKMLSEPFSFTKLFCGVKIEKVAPQIFTYKNVPGRNLNIDFYASAEKAPRPCVIVIHGGSWSQGDSKQLPALNEYLSGKGYHVAAINYRLAPQHIFPAPISDTKNAMEYLIKNSAQLNIDTNNFVLLGRSAGAQIALMAAYTFHKTSIKGVVSFYGPADMVWGAKIKTNKLVINVDKVFGDYLGGLITEVPKIYEESTACNFVSTQSTPTLLIHGSNDALVSYNHSVRLAEKLKSHNVKYYFLNLPWATHGCDFNISGPSGQISTFTIERFINSVTTQ